MSEMTQSIPLQSTTCRAPILGGALQKKMENLVKISTTIKDIAANHGTDVVCSSSTLLVGLSAILDSGNVFSLGLNASRVFFGGKRVYNILSANTTSSTVAQSEIGELLRNVQAGIGILQIHSQINTERLNELEKTLDSIETRTKHANGTIAELKDMSLNGRVDLEENCQNAFDLYEEANQLYIKSRQVLQGCAAKITNSSLRFESALSKFSQIGALLESEENTFALRADQLNILVNEIVRECEEGSSLMCEAQAELDEGISLSDEASLLMSKAAFEFGRIKEGSGEEFQKLELLAADLVKKNEESQKEIIRMKGILEEITACHEDSKKILDEMAQENQKSQQIKQGYSTSAFFAGGLLAGATAGLGLVPCLAATLMAARAYQYKDYVAGKIGDWAFNIPCEDDPNSIPVGPFEVALAFDKASSGHFGRYVKQQRSYSTGTIRINLGSEIANIRFDFRNQDAIKKSDLCELQHLMSQALLSNPKQAHAISRIIYTLETIEIDRGLQGKVKGLIPNDSPYFRGIKRLCQNLLSTTKEEPKSTPIAQITVVEQPQKQALESKPLTENHHFKVLSDFGNKACKASQSAVAVALAISKASTITYKHGSDFLSSSTSLYTGLSFLGASAVSGGPIGLLVGAGLTYAGAKRLYAIVKDIKNPQGEETFAELLKNNEAGIAVLQTIGESQSEILYQMDKSLDSVENLSKEIATSLNEIKGLALAGHVELERRRNISLELYEKSNALFKTARSNYQKTQENLANSSALYNSAIEKFKQLSELIKQDQGNFKEKAERLLKLTVEIDQECSQAKHAMDEAQKFLSEGIQLSDQASEVMHQAAFEFGKLKERASERFMKIEKTTAALTQKNTESLQNMETMKGHIKEMKAQFEDSHLIMQDLEKNNRKAQQASQGYSTGSLIAGGLAIAATVNFGLLPGIVAAFAVANLYEKKDIIAKKVCDWAFNIPKTITSPTIPIKKYGVAYTPDSHSTGYFNRYIKKQGSHTAGTLSVDLGEVVSFKINLNQTNPMEKLDQQRLSSLMHKKLEDNPSLAPQFLSILQQIEDLKVSRGGQQEKEIVGKNSLIFSSLKRYCNILIKEQHEAPLVIAKKEFATYSFTEKKKGFFNQKSQQGLLTINLGKEKVSYPFDLNQSQRLASRDLKDLWIRMKSNLAKDADLAPRYLKLLNELLSKEIQQGDQKFSHGFVMGFDPFIKPLKTMCEKIMAQKNNHSITAIS